jgi:hypothetical protein
VLVNLAAERSRGRWYSACRSFLGTYILASEQQNSGEKRTWGGRGSAGRPPDGTPICADGVDISSIGRKSSCGGDGRTQGARGAVRAAGETRRHWSNFGSMGDVVWSAAGWTEHRLRRAAAGEVLGTRPSAGKTACGRRRGKRRAAVGEGAMGRFSAAKEVWGETVKSRRKKRRFYFCWCQLFPNSRPRRWTHYQLEKQSELR